MHWGFAELDPQLYVLMSCPANKKYFEVFITGNIEDKVSSGQKIPSENESFSDGLWISFDLCQPYKWGTEKERSLRRKNG